MLLLVVLSMLVLFLMIGTAFIITAKQSERAAKAAQRGTIRLSDAAAAGELLDDVLGQLIRDTNNPHSALRFHSLLGDMYGNDGFTSAIARPQTLVRSLQVEAQVPAAYQLQNNSTARTDQFTVRWPAAGTVPITDGQLIEFDLVWFEDRYGNLSGANPPRPKNPPPPHPPSPARPSMLDNALAGQLLTFTSGPAKGQSTRIVSSQIRRMVSSSNDGIVVTLRVMTFPLADGSHLASTLSNQDLTELFALDPNNPTRVLVNGRPFNGTGVGLNPWAAANAPRLNAEEQVVPGSGNFFSLALMPNASFLMPNVIVQLPGNPLPPAGPSYFPPSTTTLDYNGRGGADESYDAVDFQNLAVAGLLGSNFAETMLPDITAPLPNSLQNLAGATLVIPSLHRPVLLNYWAQHPAFGGPGDFRDTTTHTLATNPMMLRRVLMRPNWLDHPDFTGSNPEYAAAIASGTFTAEGLKLARMVYGPWDVDNDNDGVRDSVWIDAGLPVMPGPNGKLVKPLVAILCVDLDGRANVNTDGTMDLARPVADPLDVPAVGTLAGSAPGTNNSDDTPRGIGWGPADKSLGYSLLVLPAGSPPTTPPNQQNFRWLLYGHEFNLPSGRVFMPGRYGYDDGSADGATNGTPRPGRIGFDLMAQVTMLGWPQWPHNMVEDPSNPGQFILGGKFGTPPDLRARYGVGLDVFGQPVQEARLEFEQAGNMMTAAREAQYSNLAADSPYELDLTMSAGRGVTGTANGYAGADAPFSLAELESALRIFDADAGTLPARLALLTGIRDASTGGAGELELRHRITTDSYDVPTPSVVVPPELEPLISTNAAVRRLPRSVAELFEMRVRYALQQAPAPIGGPQYKLFPETLEPAEAQEVRLRVKRLLSPDLARGERMNINRPLGNGRDDNNNGVVDEPGEEEGALWSFDRSDDGGVQAYASMPEAASDQYSNPGAAPDTLPQYAGVMDFDPTTGANFGQPMPADPREMLARHLYVMAYMLTVTDPSRHAGLQPGNNDDEALAQRLAQWAVNVVDFRDADAIMTGFEYDINPLDGWNVNDAIGDMHPGNDGFLGTPDDVADPAPDDTANHRGLVWGAERPELLINETIAWHDRNTTDEADEDTTLTGDTPADTQHPMTPDLDFDQKYMPRGAFFMELYNPWSPSPAPSGDVHQRFELPDGSIVDGGIAINTVTPDYAGVGPRERSPVWRVAVTLDDPTKRPDAQTSASQLDIERSMYFVKADDPALTLIRDPNGNPAEIADVDQDDGAAFFIHDNHPDLQPVLPGRYLVVGSGKEDPLNSVIYKSRFGQRLDQLPTARPRKPLRRVELYINDADTIPPVRLIDNVDGDNAVAELRPPGTAVTYRMEPPVDEGAVLPERPNSRGWIADAIVIQEPEPFTLSEPAIGYDETPEGANVAFARYTNPATEGDPSEEGEFALGGNIETPKPLDRPLDDFRDDLENPQEFMNLGTDVNGGRALFLQRLANPLLPHHPVFNPYRTVDRTRSYITVFNGRLPDGDEENGMTNSDAQDGFASLERGYRDQINGAATMFDLWSVQPADRDGVFERDPSRSGVTEGPEHQYSLTYIPRMTLGFLNRTFMNTAEMQPDRLKIMPKEPFPWLTWNNRPFATSGELLLVPRLDSLELLRNFSVFSDNKSRYDTPAKDKLGPELVHPASETIAREESFAHLENFMYQEPAGGGGGSNRVPRNLYRLLDYVETPSLFVGSQTWLNPSDFNEDTPPTPESPAITSANDPRVNYQPPFNNVPQYRRPGQVNLNTIFSDAVWKDLFHGNTRPDVVPTPAEPIHPGPTWADFTTSRRAIVSAGGAGGGGGGGGAVPPMQLDPALPTLFANPFRAADANQLVPIADLVTASGIDSTVLRVDPTPAAAGEAPLLAAATLEPYNNAERSAYFRMEPMSRLPNLVTTRSNVYAVWITIGFFEVDAVPEPSVDPRFQPVMDALAGKANATLAEARANPLFDRIYPGGYTLGKEDGIETGKIQRMRSFYIIDRTLPAGFEPGVDHNVENVIRLRRRIE